MKRAPWVTGLCAGVLGEELLAIPASSWKRKDQTCPSTSNPQYPLASHFLLLGVNTNVG